MKTEWLSDWEMLALEQMLAISIESGVGFVNNDSGKSLIRKLRAASHIRLSYKNDANLGS